MIIVGPVYHSRLRKTLRHAVRCKQNDFTKAIVLVFESLGHMSTGHQARGFHALGKAQNLVCSRCAKRKKRKDSGEKHQRKARRLGLVAA